MRINESEVDDYSLNPHEPEIIPYSELKNLDVTEETYLKSIINIYALTFRENGHLNHLKSLLNDDNYKIRNMAINGLIYALNNLTDCYYDKPHGNFISQTLGEGINNPLNTFYIWIIGRIVNNFKFFNKIKSIIN